MSRRLVVEADGGSRGNPGVAGYGALVRDETGRVLVERAEPLGKASNNVAEYRGLIAGLTEAAAIDPGADVTARMDSKLVVEQMSGRWKIKHEDMRRLAAQAREIAQSILAAGGSVRYEWIPRASNTDADALSNEAMDGHDVTRRYDDSDADDLNTSDGADDSAGAAADDAADDDTPSADAGDDGAPLVSAPEPLPRTQAAPDLGPATRIVLVRHGVTDLTTSGRLDGRGGLDPDLNAEGQRQATMLARGVRDFVGAGPVRVVSSGLARARQTGLRLAGELDARLESDPAWDEQSFGDWDAASVRDIAAAHSEQWQQLRDDPTYARPGGESRLDLQRRVDAAIDALVAAGGTVVVATHRTPILLVLARVLGIDQSHAWRLSIAPASMTSIRLWADGGASVEFVNSTAHLRS